MYTCIYPLHWIRAGLIHSTSAFRVMHVDKNGDFTSELRYSYLDKNICIASPAGTAFANRVPVTSKCLFAAISGERGGL